MSRALGLIETYGMVASIEAADAGLKAAEVELAGCQQVKGGLVTVKFWGEVSAVQAAVDAAADSAQKVGKLVAVHVITGLADELTEMVNGGNGGALNSPCAGICNAGHTSLTGLEKLNVGELRKLARTLPGFALTGRQISKAGKSQLIAEILKSDAAPPGGEE